VGFVDVSDSLTEVVRSILAVVDTLDLQQSLVFVLDDLGSRKGVRKGLERDDYLLKPRKTDLTHNLDEKSKEIERYE